MKREQVRSEKISMAKNKTKNYTRRKTISESITIRLVRHTIPPTRKSDNTVRN